MTKAAGFADTKIGANFKNSGMVTVNSGTLAFTRQFMQQSTGLVESPARTLITRYFPM
jgi:hypothetical protein